LEKFLHLSQFNQRSHGVHPSLDIRREQELSKKEFINITFPNLEEAEGVLNST
jgi:hypothetical protein